MFQSAVKMESKKNHPLTLKGIEDAKNIKSKYKIVFTIDEVKNIVPTEENLNYIHIDAALVSPLTRAIQTAAYGLGFDQMDKLINKNRFYISTDIREKKGDFWS